VTSVEASERLIELIRANPDIANYADGCDPETLVAAERVLGGSFPPSCRRLIEEFGTWDIAGTEFLGVYQTPAMGEALLGSVQVTLESRQRYGMPSDLVAVMIDGTGDRIVLDTSRPDRAGEYPVLAWNPGAPDRAQMERLGADFGTYALELSQRAVSHWRQSS
jgi:hypothetical protein